jgi:hypothetical protein
MTGRIKVGAWLPFAAEDVVDGRSFAWRARVGWGRITPLRILDRHADGAGRTEGRLLGRLRLFAGDGPDTARSAAARTALESVAYVPCGCEVRDERRFGELVLPSDLEVGWWFGTPRYAPFFRARVHRASRI